MQCNVEYLGSRLSRDGLCNVFEPLIEIVLNFFFGKSFYVFENCCQVVESGLQPCKPRTLASVDRGV